MKLRIQATRLLLGLVLFVLTVPGFAGQAQIPQDKKEARDYKIFADRVQAYIRLQKSLLDSLSTLKITNDAGEIVKHQHAMAEKIAHARRDAHKGDIFTHDVSKRFRKIIHNEFHGPEGRLARRTIRQDDPSKVMARLQVNNVFPEGIPLTTTPPTLLFKLPELPQELAYRFVGHDLTLVDINARLIVDLIENVIP
jgi:competence protein ComGC